MSYQYHDETIVTELPEDTVFVFGSNLAGLHASGAARVAAQHFAAVKGVGRGWAGQSFAIPTLNEHYNKWRKLNTMLLILKFTPKTIRK